MGYIGAGISRFNTADELTVTGDVTASGTLLPTGDTAAGDDAAIGFTSAEGLILTGQGSTSDVTIKNDADATVAFVPTGADDLRFPDNAQIQMGTSGDLEIYHNGTDSFIEDKGTGNLHITTNGNNIQFMKDQTEHMVVMRPDAEVELYYNGTMKFETASTGVDITGGFTATDGCTITTADNTDQLTLKSTDADASVGPVLRMNRDSGSPADNDLLGSIIFQADDDGGNSINFVEIITQMEDASAGSRSADLFLKTRTNGSLVSRIGMYDSTTAINDEGADIDFRVESTGNANMFFVDAGNGLVGVGTASPQARLNVHDDGSSSNSILLQLHSDSTSFSSNVMEIITERSTTNSTFNVFKYRTTGSASTRFFIRDSGNVENTNNSYGAVSDESLKKNITDAASQWDDIKALTVRKFHFNEQADDDPKMLGLVAQEVEKISAGLVSTAYDEDEEKDIKSVKYSVLYMKAVKALQEAMTRIETLEAKVATLEAG